MSSLDPSGLDAWMTLSSAHAGIRVEVRSGNDEKTVCGCLLIDYHAMGYLDDGRTQRSSGHAIFGEKGFVKLNYRPGKCEETPYLLKGTPAQDRTLVKWAIEQVEESVDDRLKDLSKSWSRDKRPRQDSRWYKYAVFEHNTCVQHTYEAAKGYLGHDWLFLRSDATVSGPPHEIWGSDVHKRGDWMIPFYEKNFKEGVYHGEDNENRRKKANKKAENISKGVQSLMLSGQL